MMYPYGYKIKITENMEKMLIAINKEWPLITIQNIWEDALVDKFIELVDKKDGFRPCPMCGASLSMKDVYYFDEEGNECSGACDQFTRKVAIGCDCGFHYTADIEALYDGWEDLEDGKWEEKFMALANRRHKGGE